MKKEQYEEIALKAANLVAAKNDAYGDSLSKMAQILELLYGETIPKEKYEELHYIVRILDKVSRVASGNKDAFEENPFEDIMGYALNKLAHSQYKNNRVLRSFGRLSAFNPSEWQGMTEKNESVYIRYRHGLLSIWVGKPNKLLECENTIFSEQLGSTADNHMTTKQLLILFAAHNLFEVQND